MKKNVLFLLVLLFSYSAYAMHDAKVPLVHAAAQHVQSLHNEQPEHWMDIFIHGSHGSFFGLMSVSDVLKDKTEDSLYKKVQSEWRKNADIFSANRLMGPEGLCAIDSSPQAKDLVAAGIVQGYEKFTKEVNKLNQVRHHYTFGWSGLLSQTERRKEALNLYRELSQEITKFNKNGITPKVRIIAHSHGGNVAANLAACSALFDNFFVVTDDEKESLKAMDALIFDSGFKLKNRLIIDELHMFGTPIQPETECLFFLPYIKLLVNYYSENDSIQGCDFMTTKRRKSSQRINMDQHFLFADNRIVQVKIAVERPIGQKKEKNRQLMLSPTAYHLKSPFSGGKFLCQYPKDPTHGDLWCIKWKKTDTFVAPLPIVMMTPILSSLILKNPTINDVSVNMQATEKLAVFSVYNADFTSLVDRYTMPISLVDEAKKLLEKARPQGKSVQLSTAKYKKDGKILSKL